MEKLVLQQVRLTVFLVNQYINIELFDYKRDRLDSRLRGNDVLVNQRVKHKNTIKAPLTCLE